MVKLKKYMKIIIIFAMVIIGALTGVEAKAITASANGAVSTAKTENGGLIFTGSKILDKNGKEGFCIDSAKRLPNGNTYTTKEVLSDQGLWNLIRYGKSLNANWAEIQTGVHVYLTENKGNSSYKIDGGGTISTSWAKQNSKVKKMVAYGKSHNKLEKVAVNNANMTTHYNKDKNVNQVTQFRATGFSGNFKITGVPAGVSFYKNGTNTKLNVNNIPVNTSMDIRVDPKINVSATNMKIQPLTATQEVGIVYTPNTSSYQRMARTGKLDPLTPVTFKLTSKKALIDITGLKDMDNIDKYEDEIEYNGKPYYQTKDGQPVMFKTETGALAISTKLKNPSLNEFKEKDLYNKPLEYEYVSYKHATKVQDKLDEQGNKIAIADEAGQEPKITDENGELTDNPNWTPTYEQETVNVLDEETGYPIVEAIKDENDEYIYAKATTPFNLGSEKELNNIYSAMKKDNVKFGLYSEDRKTLLKEVVVDNGKFSFSGLMPDTIYYAKELTTNEAEGFIVDPTFYKVTGKAGQTIKINGGKEIVNHINYSIVTASKKGATGQDEIDDATLQLLDEKENIVGEGISKAGQNLEFKVKPGNYFIKETIAPEGYQILTVLIPVIVEESGEIVHVDVKNELIKADMEITKTDITDSKELVGAGICLSSKDNKEFTITIDGKDTYTKKYCWTSAKEAKKFTLYYGNYLLEETIAPKGYLKLKTTVPFKVDKSGVQKHKIKNEPVKYTRTGGLKEKSSILDDIINSLKIPNLGLN